MKPRHRRPTALLTPALLAASCLLRAATGHADGPAVELGREIYHSGAVAGGPEIIAVLGQGGVEVPATLMPCATCHGADGRGKPEGGVAPSDLTWGALTKPYGVVQPSGRRHPAYNDNLVRRAFTMGVDPAGNELLEAMPRYRMTREQAAGLVAYIKRLGEERDPGVGEDRLILGVVLPPFGRLDGWSAAIRRALDAYVDRLNGQGGVYGRRLELTYVAAPEEPANHRDVVARFLDEARVFALVAGFMAGAEEPLSDLLAERRVPSIGPFTLEPQVAFPLNRYVFYIQPGPTQQAQALVDFAGHKLGGGGDEAVTVAVIHPGRNGLREIAAAAAARGREQRLQVPVFEGPLSDPSAVVAAARSAGSAAVLFLGSEAETVALLGAAEAATWRPAILLLGSLAGGALEAVEAGRAEDVFLALPNSSGDRSERALADYRALQARYDLPGHSTTLQLSALGAMELLVEGLRRAGRDLSRDKLVDTLETLFDFETGITPPLTFGPNRRIGASGAYVVPLSRVRTQPPTATDWVAVR